MLGDYTNSKDVLIMKKEIIDQKIDKSQIKKNYADICIHEGYYINTGFQHLELCKESIKHISKLDRKKIDKEENFAVTVNMGTPEERILYFLTLKNFKGEMIGYIISSHVDSRYSDIIFSYIIKEILLIMFILVLYYLYNKFKNSNKQLEKYSKFIDESTIVNRTDLKGRIIEANDAFVQISGYSKQEIIGKTHSFLRHPDMPKETFKRLWETIKAGKVWKGKIKNLRKDGISYVTQVSIHPVFDENEEIKEYISTCYDITEIEELKEKLKQDLKLTSQNLEDALFISEQHQKAMDTSDIIVRLNRKGEISYVNQKFMDTTEYLEEDIIGECCESIKHDIDQNDVFTNLWETIFKKRTPWHGELSCYSKYDRKIYLYIGVFPIFNKQNKIIQFLIVGHDLTDTIEMQQKHQESQVENAKFSALGQLSAGVTHEINTPLTFAKGNLELIDMDIDDLPQSELKTSLNSSFSSIKEAVNRISIIVDNMREMSQHTKEERVNRNVIKTLQVSLAMIYNRSKIISHIYVNNKLYSLGDEIEGEMNVLIHPQRVEQVWIVIVNNALDELEKKMDFEARRIDITTFQTQTHYVVKIADNAGGIDERIMDILFEPFASTKESKGMGIGLNIAKKIIEDQEGEIRAYNEGAGAVFEVSFHKQREEER